MTDGDVISIVQSAYWTGLRMVAWPLIIGLVAGLAIAVFQALTQIQEMTLTFVPKIVAILGMTVLTLPTMYGLLETLMMRIADQIIAV
jgi:flagellar biosynthetic protein FliQ